MSDLHTFCVVYTEANACLEEWNTFSSVEILKENTFAPYANELSFLLESFLQRCHFVMVTYKVIFFAI